MLHGRRTDSGGLWIEPECLILFTPGTEQSQPVAFPPSTEPTFVTVPQRGFGEPFVLNPGIWALLVEAEGVLLVRQEPQQGGEGPGTQSLCILTPYLSQDYVVLLPSTYYEAALLQHRVTEACTYRPSALHSTEK